MMCKNDPWARGSQQRSRGSRRGFLQSLCAQGALRNYTTGPTLANEVLFSDSSIAVAFIGLLAAYVLQRCYRCLSFLTQRRGRCLDYGGSRKPARAWFLKQFIIYFIRKIIISISSSKPSRRFRIFTIYRVDSDHSLRPPAPACRQRSLAVASDHSLPDNFSRLARFGSSLRAFVYCAARTHNAGR